MWNDTIIPIYVLLKCNCVSIDNNLCKNLSIFFYDVGIYYLPIS